MYLINPAVNTFANRGTSFNSNSRESRYLLKRFAFKKIDNIINLAGVAFAPKLEISNHFGEKL